MDTFLLDLEEIYRVNHFNLKKALDYWKEQKFSAEQIREAIQEDTGLNITRAEAKFLQRIGKEIFEDNKVFARFFEQSTKEIDKQTEIERRMAKSRIIKFTPEVRRMVEKVGKNTFKNRYGSVEWSIILVDGIPHLARKDTPEDERGTKIALPEVDTK